MNRLGHRGNYNVGGPGLNMAIDHINYKSHELDTYGVWTDRKSYVSRRRNMSKINRACDEDELVASFWTRYFRMQDKKEGVERG